MSEETISIKVKLHSLSGIYEVTGNDLTIESDASFIYIKDGQPGPDRTIKPIIAIFPKESVMMVAFGDNCEWKNVP